MNPKVSIILTTHGEAPYLKQAIGSVLAQTSEDWECIVAYDGLFEGMQLWMRQELDNRFQVAAYNVPSVQCRFAYTINEAFKLCKGDFITYLCHDDLYLPWRLGWMKSELDYKPIDVVFGYQQLLEEMLDGTKISRGVRQGNSDQAAGTVDHSSVMHRRECFEKAGGWDENAPMRYGDAYFWLRLQNASYKFHCIPEVLDVHRFNPHSVTWKEDHP